jgi:hypothetical protein
MELRIDDGLLVVHLSRGEKFWGFHRDFSIPLTSIVKVRANRDPWLTSRGWRATGVNVQGRVARGTRRHGQGWDFVFLTREGQAVEMDLAGGRYARLTISVDDVDTEVTRIASAAGIAPGD